MCAPESAVYPLVAGLVASVLGVLGAGCAAKNAASRSAARGTARMRSFLLAGIVLVIAVNRVPIMLPVGRLHDNSHSVLRRCLGPAGRG